MCKLHPKNNGRQLSLVIPSKILSETSLTFNDKILLGFDCALSNKLGYNNYTNNHLSSFLNLHINSISNSRKALVENGYLFKTGRKYHLSEKSLKILEGDNQIIYLPFAVYNLKTIKSGEKLLWGLYNSVSRGFKDYFAKRLTTANNLSMSVETVTKYTKALNQAGLLKLYTHNSGYCSNQTVIVTCEVFNGEISTELNRTRDHRGDWIRSANFIELKKR
ncbi:hypothetical protein [Gillisia sp. JM1]|uniref:hypothetical protein n=1 Tax=Gillisia sp. JM1 TaxID=1283286 RepID=UPI00041EBEDA|nr:hypothetical protein [Gillisia sp. JM1]